MSSGFYDIICVKKVCVRGNVAKTAKWRLNEEGVPAWEWTYKGNHNGYDRWVKKGLLEEVKK